MPTSFNLLALLDLLGVVQALLLASVLLTIKRGNVAANRLLAAFLITLAISIGGATFGSTEFRDLLPQLRKAHQPFYYLGGPLLFLYITTLIRGQSSPGKKQLLHFIPFVLCLIYVTPYFFLNAEARAHADLTYYGWTWYIFKSAVLLVQFLTYLILTIWSVVVFSRKVSAQPSPRERAILSQARFVLATFVALWVVGIISYILNLKSDHQLGFPDLMVPVGVSLFVYALAYVALRRPDVMIAMEDLPSAKKYERSSLTIERGDVYLKRLLQLMENEKPYADGSLTLQKLAKALAIPPHHLSQIINEQLNQNFFDFINNHRIEEAKRMLIDPARQHISILAISEEVGFNSKSAFNAAFKKHTQMTPSEFRKASGGSD